MLSTLIKRSTRRRQVAAIVLILICGILGLLNFRYYLNLIGGPFELTTAEVLSITDTSITPKYRVTLTADASYDTGYEYAADAGGRAIYSYAVLRFEDRLLLVQLIGSLNGNIPRRLTGELMNIHPAVQAQVLNPIFAADSTQREVFLPYMMFAHDFSRTGYFGLAGWLVLVLISLYLLSSGLFYRLQPARHPAARTLRPYGDPLAVAEQIEAEAQAEHPVSGNFHFLAHWLVYRSPSAMEAVRYEDIVWMYRKVTGQRSNSTAAGKTYLVCVHTRHGNILTHIAPESQAITMLDTLTELAPQALTGDSPELQRQWRFNRKALIAGASQQRGIQPDSGLDV